MKNAFLAVLIVTMLFSVFVSSMVFGETPIRVLIVDDHRVGYYHMPTATALRDVIRLDKRFDVVLVEDAETLGTDLLFDYDVALLHFKNYVVPKRNAAMKANLEKFVEEGGGLFVFHFSCGAFEDWPECDKLFGRVWDPKKRGHDPYGLFNVQIIDKEHPVTATLDDFETHDELYTCLKDSEVPIHVLADAVSKVDGRKYPMAFVLERGKGRVFHTTLGHDVKSLSAAGFQKMIKHALLWCAKQENLSAATPVPTKEPGEAGDARIKEITASVPEGARLRAYFDCGGSGRFEEGLKIVAPEEAKSGSTKFLNDGDKLPVFESFSRAAQTPAGLNSMPFTVCPIIYQGD